MAIRDYKEGRHAAIQRERVSESMSYRFVDDDRRT